jgi:hypothetical protein
MPPMQTFNTRLFASPMEANDYIIIAARERVLFGGAPTHN